MNVLDVVGMTGSTSAIQPQRPPKPGGAALRVTRRRAETRQLHREGVPVFAGKGPPSPPPGCPVIPPARSQGLEVGDRCEDTPVVVIGLVQVKFGEDAAHLLFACA